MSKRKNTGKPTRIVGESPVMINIKITLPRRVIWLASGFLTGSITTETLVRVITSLHGG